MFQKRSLWYLISLLLVLSLALTAGCGSATNTDQQDPAAGTQEPASNETPAINESEEIIKATDSFLNTEDATFTIDPADVKKIVDEQDATYQIVSIRSPEHYAIGHIPGAINIPFTKIAEEESLQKLDPSKKIIVVCYTGHTASQTAMFLNQLGYKAMAMKFGMSGWTTDPKVYALNDGKVWDGKAPNFEVETEPNEAEAKFDIPVVNNGAVDAKDAIIKASQAYLASRAETSNLSVAEVKEKAVNSAEYQIVSVRSPGDYANGHVPGAINIPFKQIAKEENLKKLDPNKKIIVYCYTGHTGSFTTMFFNQLGYEAYNMKFGMTGWTEDEKVLSNNGAPVKGYQGTAPQYETVKQ